jgi:cytochrome P450
MKELQEEIDGLDFADQDRQLFCHTQLKQLPYLNAVLNETMRMNPVPAAGLERIADKDFTLAGKLHVPKGTELICNVYHAQMDEKYWTNACSFEPERWLPGNETRRDLEAFFPFGIGSRNCIGENFAWMQMRLVLATLIGRFDLTPLAMEMEQAKEVRHFITITILNNSFSVVAHPRQQSN